jgi:heterodisulfide reductase subunit B
MHHVAPIRNLIRVKDADYDKVMTVCAMCYNTLKRANMRIKSDPESLDILNNFMDREETEYKGDVQVFHLLEFLKDEIGFREVADKVTKPLKKLKVASYYGCLLVRPKEIGFDDMENPTVLEDLMSALGADSVDFPFKTECCGAYQTVDKPEIIANRTNQILTSAREQGGEIVVVSCPLCAFNLDQRQKQTSEIYPEFKHIPVLYFTQLLAIALGCPEESLRFDLNFIDPKPILKDKGLI